jgi:phosphonate transport system substrate-binding protein
MKRRLVLAAPLLVAPVPAFAQGKDPRRLRLALLSDENAATIIQNARPLAAHLDKVLGRDIEVVVTTDYSSMIETMRFGRSSPSRARRGSSPSRWASSGDRRPTGQF